MTLLALLDSYTLEHELKPASVRMLKDSINAYSAWLKHPATIDDLCSDTINHHLIWMQEQGRAPATRQSRRRVLLTFWRYAIEIGKVDRPVRRVRKVTLPRHNPKAWTEEEIRQLVETARGLKGYLSNGTAKAAYWASLIMAAWDSALRLGDLLSFERGWIAHSDGTLTITQGKTGYCKTIVFRPETLTAIDLCIAGPVVRRYIWAYPSRREEFYKAFRRIVKKSGIRRGTFKWIRRASTTAVEKLQRGAGKDQAGHQDGKVTQRFYIDQSQLGVNIPLPPSLDRAGAADPQKPVYAGTVPFIRSRPHIVRRG